MVSSDGMMVGGVFNVLKRAKLDPMLQLFLGMLIALCICWGWRLQGSKWGVHVQVQFGLVRSGDKGIQRAKFVSHRGGRSF